MLATKQITPRVSIGMPVYNGEKYIRDALDSLLNQTFSDFELIISDNASTDRTEEICGEYASRDSRISYFRQTENNGAITNFQFVLDHASGEFFMWAAYDDLWSDGFIENAVGSLKNLNVDFVFPSFELRSIKLGYAKKFNLDIFKFIESENRRVRVLSFCNLHYLSLSVNIVYSLFRVDFLNKITSIQGIVNEGALGATILSYGRGALNKGLFSKQYQLVWPGMFPSYIRFIKGRLNKKNVMVEAQQAIKASRINLIKIFPEYLNELNYIYDNYHPSRHDKYYRICTINKVLELTNLNVSK